MKFNYIYNKLLNLRLINDDILINEIVLEWEKIFDGKEKIKLIKKIKINKITNFTFINFIDENNDEYENIIVTYFKLPDCLNNINISKIPINLYEYILFNTFMKTYADYSQNELIEKYEIIIESIAEFIVKKINDVGMMLIKNNYDLFSDLLDGKYKTKKKYKNYNLIIIEEEGLFHKNYRILTIVCKNPLIQSLLITGKSEKFYNDCIKKIPCKGKIINLLKLLCKCTTRSRFFQTGRFNNFYSFFLELFKNFDEEKFEKIFIEIFNGLRGIKKYLNLTSLIDKNYIVKYVEMNISDLNNNDLLEICSKLNIQSEIYKNKSNNEILNELSLNAKISDSVLYNFIVKNKMYSDDIFNKIMEINREKIFLNNPLFITKIKFDKINPFIIIIKRILNKRYSPYYLKIFKLILEYNKENKNFLTQELFDLIKENKIKYFYFVLPKIIN